MPFRLRSSQTKSPIVPGISRMVFVAQAMMTFVHASCARQHQTTIVGRKPLVVAVIVATTFAVQLSAADTVGGAGKSVGQRKVLLMGTPISTGAIVSRTVI